MMPRDWNSADATDSEVRQGGGLGDLDDQTSWIRAGVFERLIEPFDDAIGCDLAR